MTMRIVAEKSVPFLKGVVEDFADVKYLSSDEFTPTNVHDADVLIVRSINNCTQELLEGSNVKLITSATIGFDHIDTTFCDKSGIVWKNVPGCNSISVSQYIISSLLIVAKRKGETLKGKTLGIIGVGHVGTEVERVCSALGMKILRNDPPREEQEGREGFVSLDTICEEADIITFHTPLIKEGLHATKHLADKSFFEKLKRKPWYINSARGAINDTKALLDAKNKALVSELIIDCWENEPTINKELLDLASIATPHIAGFSADGKVNAIRACLDDIINYYNINIQLKEISPQKPTNSTIDMNELELNSDKDRISQVILHCFDPSATDKALRETPERFEWFRSNYPHPREFSAYKIKNATPEEIALLQKIGFTFF